MWLNFSFLLRMSTSGLHSLQSSHYLPVGVYVCFHLCFFFILITGTKWVSITSVCLHFHSAVQC